MTAHFGGNPMFCRHGRCRRFSVNCVFLALGEFGLPIKLRLVMTTGVFHEEARFSGGRGGGSP
jgi:hypothetical protein